MRYRKHLKARWLALPVAATVLMAASPMPRTYDLRFSSNDPVLNTPTSPVVARAPGLEFETAPTPNRDVSAPAGPAGGNDAHLSPGLFSRARQNRGDGYLSGSTAQGEQDRHAMPGAGINLTMPLSK